MATDIPKSVLTPKHIDLKHMFPDIPRSTYLTHGFDSYPAKMIPHMARFLIEKVSRPGQTILDPFCGSGAVLIESLISGRNAIGVDLNSLAIILAIAKTTSYDTQILEKQLGEILKRAAKCSRPHQYDFPNSDYWFTPATLRKLGEIKATLDKYLPKIDKDYAFFWKAVAASIVRQCSKADTRGPKPFISKKAREKRSGKHFDPFKLFESEARSWISIEQGYVKKLKEKGADTGIELIQGDSRSLSKLLKNKTIDAVITSPPYLSAQDYYRSSKLQRFILGDATYAELIQWSKRIIGSDRLTANQELLDEQLPCDLAETIKSTLLNQTHKHSKRNARIFAKYVMDMATVLKEIGLILKKGSPCVIVLGYNLISHIVIPTPEVIIQLASKEGLKLKLYYSDKIRDRWVPTIRNGHKGVIDEEHLLVFEKSA
jgi:DNA modification methylase